MVIRKAKMNYIPRLVEIDRSAYGKYGADKKYFEEKYSSSNTKILVVENMGKITGFAVFELLQKDEVPLDFTELEINTPLEDVWIHIIAFTTETNYKDVESDSKLVKAIEKETRKMGSKTFCVPLSIDHPFLKCDVFGFWEKSGYRNVGTINWFASPKEKIKCYLYKK